MIDLHTHVLPGFDDGVRSLEEALELLAAAAAEGVRAVAATPHVSADYPTTAARMEAGVAALRREVEGSGLELELVTGGELALQRLWQLDRDELRRFTYAGVGRWLLLELPDAGVPPLLAETAAALARDGIGVVVAHPERNAAVRDDPAVLAPLLERGAVLQITAASLTGALGARLRDAALRLLDLDAPALLASDAHGTATANRSSLADAIGALADPALAAYLCERAPAAVLAGDDVPARA